nr:hypothetical protein [Tanacetum cinerariifolium]
RARIAQSSALSPVADEPASSLRDVSQSEACLTDSGFGADQDRANIAKTSTLPYDLAPRVTSPAVDEGSMQQTELEINMLKARVKLLEDREGGGAERSGDDAPIKGRNLNKGEAAAEREYHQFALELPLERRIELINDLVRYQDNYAKVHKYQSQQRKPWSKKQKRDYYMAVIKSNLRWKVKDFRGMAFEEIEAKFTTV